MLRLYNLALWTFVTALIVLGQFPTNHFVMTLMGLSLMLYALLAILEEPNE